MGQKKIMCLDKAFLNLYICEVLINAEIIRCVCTYSSFTWYLFSPLVPNTPSFTFLPDCPGLAFVDIVWQVC